MLRATSGLAEQLRETIILGIFPLVSVDPSKAALFAKSVQQYFPALDPAKLKPGYSGIRTKLKTAAGAPSDFIIRSEKASGLPGLVNLFGIESPGLTSSLAIAERVESLLAETT